MIRTFASLAVLLATLVTASTATSNPSRPPLDRPNVILIMADDISWEAFECYGAEDYRTPNIDALAASGIRFRHAYSTPICTPTVSVHHSHSSLGVVGL